LREKRKPVFRKKQRDNKEIERRMRPHSALGGDEVRRTGLNFRALRALARIGAGLVLLAILATLNQNGRSVPAPFAHDAIIRFESVPLDNSAPGRTRLGKLHFLAGWSLSSSNGYFGGISAMHVEGGIVTALSDSGHIIRFAVPDAVSGSMRGRIDPLGDGPGSPLRKSNRDTESLAIAGNHAWVGFERRNMVWRYRTSDWRSDADAAPAAMAHWPKNGGPEGLVRLRDGRFLVFAEDARLPDGSSQLLLFDSDPALSHSRSVLLGYRGVPGFYATDAAELPDGRLLILNRRFSIVGSFTAKLAIAALPGKGRMVSGRVIATLKSPVTVDNMEALSVTSEGGRTIVWIASDDNFSRPLQRTLLLKFALLD
jgi:hypothetical protein